ncbi:lactase/phlorizin hydrolase-like [Cydia amplana]|uniref:lactase/phlorizin hydrolase-like n=1 Tax=Cydia amplana TaxID=1869771 RepID=UPI002FE58509
MLLKFTQDENHFANGLSAAVLGFSNDSVRKFKDGFLFGAATAAYQVEGAWNEDGKGKSIWDHYFHSILGQESALGDMASDSYHNYKRDVEMLRELGVDVYRFSMSWPRVLPGGFSSIKNEPGLQYYDNLIDELLKYNIQPMVTIYHFDLPRALLELGGWSNPHSVKWFEDYARVLFDRYASKVIFLKFFSRFVKYWITVNQPNTVCHFQYHGDHLPKSIEGALAYVCSKNVLLAHARTYRMYEKEYKQIYGGSVGISIVVNWVEPVTNSTEDVEAAEIYREFSYGLYMDPIWSKSGDFPKLVKDRVAKKSKEQGFARSRLPSLTKDEIKLIKGSSDFLGLNHYTTYLISPSKVSLPAPSFADDMSIVKTGIRDEWTRARSAWLKSTPDGLYKVCLLLNQRYDYPTIFVTENGWSTDKGLQDPSRSEYIQQYLKALLLAIEDGTQALGYIYWSLMDNVQWHLGIGLCCYSYCLVKFAFLFAVSVSLQQALTVKVHKMRIILSTGILSLIVAVSGFSDNSVRRFKDGFLFGAASAAYQVEGAWNEDGKGQSVWDLHFHSDPEQGPVPGDVASDSYHNYKRDVEMLRELGVDVYRFSISWPRVLPEGFSSKKNEAGLQYYDNLIDELLKHNIQPIVTMYHFDLPVVLQHLGGWANPYSVDWFEDYARVLFDRYASKVEYWITVNQPNSVCEVENYENRLAKSTQGVMDYLCAKHILLAHARTYRMYEKEYKKVYGGSIGISISVNWAEPVTNSTEDVEAAEIYREFKYGMYLNPIWSKSGDFPKLVKDRVAKKSKEQGFVRSRLPSLTKDDIKLIRGSADFLGLNHYTTFLTSPSKGSHPIPSFADDVSVELTTKDEWTQSHSAWLKSAPYGLYKACLHLNKHYDYPTIFVTENGWSTDKGLQDPSRSEYIQQYLKALLLAIEDGTQALGYIYWSLMDNVEWMAGTSERFGLYEVDFDSPERTRLARQSALVYKRIIQKRVVEEGWKPKNLKISVSKVKTEL